MHGYCYHHRNSSSASQRIHMYDEGSGGDGDGNAAQTLARIHGPYHTSCQCMRRKSPSQIQRHNGTRTTIWSQAEQWAYLRPHLVVAKHISHTTPLRLQQRRHRQQYQYEGSGADPSKKVSKASKYVSSYTEHFTQFLIHHHFNSHS